MAFSCSIKCRLSASLFRTRRAMRRSSISKTLKADMEAAMRPLSRSVRESFSRKNAPTITNASLLSSRKLGIELGRRDGRSDDRRRIVLDSSRPHHEIEFLAQHNLNAYPHGDVPHGFSDTGWKAAFRADWTQQLTPLLRETDRRGRADEGLRRDRAAGRTVSSPISKSPG